MKSPILRIIALIAASAALFAVLLFGSASTARAQDADLVRIKQQLAVQLIATEPVKDPRFMGAESRDQGAGAWVKSLAADGSWPDIRYDDKTAGAWSPIMHLSRVVELARACASPEKTPAGSMLRPAFHSALGYWFAKDFRSPNWFHNEIRVPQYMGQILIMAESEITAGERSKALAILARSGIRMTGQNRVWLSGNVLMRGVLEDNATLVQQARDAISENIIVTPEEGLQADNSYHQHGAQLQMGNYGLAFARDAVAWMEALRGTRMAFAPEKTAILRDYLLKGVNRAVWNGMMDISSCGRQLFVRAQAGKAATARDVLVALEKSDPAFASEYRKALRSYEGRTAEADQLTGNTHFWRSDFMVDRRPAYYASVKMSSARVIGTEMINKENLSGALLGDGVLFLYKTGREYEDIFPVWDWRRLPGATAAQKGKVLPLRPQNTAAFVGGVSDGTDGAAVLDYDRKGLMSRNPLGLTARKSWFFFDNQIVCLGAGITTELLSGVTTSVNQSLLNGPVVTGQGNQTETLPAGRKDYAALQWAWHDGTGYVFPQTAKATVVGGEQKGAWTNVYVAGSPEPVVKNVFSLWIDHGMSPRDASYAYVILPAATEKQTRDYFAKPAVEILSNTADLQVVRCGAATSGVFYKPGALAYAAGKRLSVTQPCLVLIKEDVQGAVLTVSDPTQKLASLDLTWNGKSVKVTLPAGADAGSSIRVTQP